MNLPDSVCAGLAQISPMSTWAVLLSKATVLLAIAWLIHFTLARANPRWRVLLWRGVVVGLALLVVWSSGLPGLEVRLPAPETAAIGPSPSLPSAVVGDSPADLPQAGLHSTEIPATAQITTTARQALVDAGHDAVLPAGRFGPSLPWQNTLLSIWGFGVVLLVVRSAIGYLRLGNLLRISQSAPDAVVAEARRIGTALGCRRTVEIRSSPRFAVPFLCGLLRPVMVLPERMCQPAYRSLLPGIVAHELAHVRSRDFGWNAGLHVVSILLWFHPLAWRIGLAHRATCDAVCDAVSASYLGNVHVYCRTLARIAVEGAASFPTVGLTMARTCDVRRRVAALERMVFAMPLGRRAVAVTTLVGLVAAALLGGVRLTLAQSAAVPTDRQAAASSESNVPENSPKDPGAPKTGTEGSTKPGYRPMRIQVLQRNGKPIVNAGITVRAMTSLPFGPIRYRTNTEGNATIEVPKEDLEDLQILVWHDKHVTVGASWKGNAVTAQVPENFTFTLDQGTVFGGIVRDEQGKPIVAAEVTVEGRRMSPNDPLWVSISDTTKTDTEGKWQVHRIPKDLAGFDLTVKLKRPDVSGIVNLDLKTLSIDKLRARSAVLVMPKGIVVEGTVTDPQGKPVPEAAVGLFAELSGSSNFPRTKTDQRGHYRFAVTDPGEYTLAAAAEGYAPDSRRVTMRTEPQIVDLQLREGEMIRLRVVDEEGKPMAGVVVSMVFDSEYWNALMLDYQSSIGRDEDRHMVTDSEGRWSRLWIPKDKLTFHISKPGYAQVQERVAPGEQEQVVTLQAGGWAVAGRVLDRQTKAPVTKFRVVEGDGSGSGNHDVRWREGLPVEDESGRYRATWDTSGDSRRVIRIEAEDYLPSEARWLKADERQVTFDVELSRGQAVAGVVLSPDGKPLADAEVALCTATRGLFLQNGRPLRGQPQLIVRTEADGRFSFTPQGEPYLLIVLHDRGFARVEGKPGPKEITVRPWACVEGTLRIGGKPGADEMISLDFNDHRFRAQESLSPSERVARRIYRDYHTQTDAEGHFAFERVLPDHGRISRCAVSKQGQMRAWIPTHTAEVECVTGKTTHVQLERAGRPVTGKLVLPNDEADDRDWSFASATLDAVQPPGPTMPAPPIATPPIPEHIDPEKDREAAIKWWEEWKETEAGKRFQEQMRRLQEAWARQMVSYSTKVEPDGSLCFEDIPAGDYRLTAKLEAPPADGQIIPGGVIGHLAHSFTVPEIPGGRSDQPVDLGTLALEPWSPR